MSNAFTNFLGGVVEGTFGDTANVKDYQHADRLYVRNTYARMPKVGFLYYVVFNINKDAVRDKQWLNRQGIRDVGLLVKRIDLPKFSIATETLNQYNRKTVVQTRLTYNSVGIDFHDDNSDITTNLWKNYYKYYFADSNYGDSPLGGSVAKSGFKSSTTVTPTAYNDTKYGLEDYAYGFDNYQSKAFFTSIDIYVLHQKQFTKYTLVNPKVTDWSHDSVGQDDGAKILASKMSVTYENVLYSAGKIVKGREPNGFAAVYYDTSPSPLSIGGNGTNTLFGPGGVIAGVENIFDIAGKEDKGPLDYLNLAISANTLAKNTRQLSKSGLATEGYSIVSGVLRNVGATGNQPGGVSESVKSGLASQGIGINLFSSQNSSINGETKAQPKKLTGN